MYRASSSGGPYVPLQVEELEDRRLLSSDGFVTGLYNAILHRAPSPAEVNGWVTAMHSGASPEQVALAFTTSAERLSNVIRADYEIFLGRQPALAEVSAWLGQLQTGQNEKQVEAAILASDEFFTRHGASTVPWLNGIYQDVLGRAADAAGLNLFSQQIQDRVPRESVAGEIVTSLEADARLVTAAYHDLFQRNPDSGGLSAWVAALQGGLTPAQLLAVLASSQEFIDLTAQGVLDVPPAPEPEPVVIPDSEPVPIDTVFLDTFVPAPVVVDPVVVDPFVPDLTSFDTGGFDFSGFDTGGFDSGGFDSGDDCGC
jgi:hypothetical protein